MIRNRKLPPLAALRAFEAAARHLSFQRAAGELAVTPTAISHQIRLLEDVLGFALFTRQVRQVALTEAGERLYPTLRDGFDAFDRALADLAPGPRRAAVTLTATIQFTARRLLPALGSFRERFPDFDLLLHSSNEPVDLAAGLAVYEGPRFSSDDHAVQAAVAGHGVMIGSLILARPEIDAGLLVHPFGPVIEGESYHMLATPANMACADVRAVCAWLAESVAGFTAGDHPLPAA